MLRRRPLALMLALATLAPLLAGCLEPPPPAPVPVVAHASAPTTEVEERELDMQRGPFVWPIDDHDEPFWLQAGPSMPWDEVHVRADQQRASPGSFVPFHWSANMTGLMWPERSEIRYSRTSSPLASLDAYPYVVARDLLYNDHETIAHWRAEVPMPPADIFARAYVVRNGEEAWSNEVHVVAREGAGWSFDLTLPDLVEAGVPAPVRGAVTPESEGALIVFAARGAGDTHYEESDLGAEGAERTYVVLDGAGGGTGAGELLLPVPGEWYVRVALYEQRTNPYTGHRSIGRALYSGEEQRVDVAPPSSPNLQILMIDPPIDCGPSVCGPKENVMAIALNAPDERRVSVELLAFADNTTRDAGEGLHMGAAEDVGVGRAIVPYVLPDGTWYVRALAIIDGQEVWSEPYLVLPDYQW